jgi:hypothetical protein
MIKKCLTSGVVNLSKEVLTLISISVLSQPKGKDSKVSNEKNSKKTNIINSEPLIGSVSSHSSTGGNNSGDESSSSGHHGLGRLSSKRSYSTAYYENKIELVKYLIFHESGTEYSFPY